MTRYSLITTLLCFVLVTGCGSPTRKSEPKPTPTPVAAPLKQGLAPNLVIGNPFEKLERLKEPLPDLVSVSLTWDASPSDGITGYNIYLSQGAEYTLCGTVPGIGVTISALRPGMQYSFYVTAFDDTSESDPSEIVSWISNTTLSLDSVTGLHLTGVTGWIYEVQASPDLFNWSVLQTIKFGASGVFTMPIDMTRPKMFFRLKRVATQ